MLQLTWSRCDSDASNYSDDINPDSHSNTLQHTQYTAERGAPALCLQYIVYECVQAGLKGVLRMLL